MKFIFVKKKKKNITNIVEFVLNISTIFSTRSKLCGINKKAIYIIIWMVHIESKNAIVKKLDFL